MSVVSFERSLSTFLGLRALEIAPPPKMPRLIAMVSGSKLLIHQAKWPFTVEAWNHRSIGCLAGHMPEGSAFITHVHEPYESLAEFANSAPCSVWERANIGSLHVYGNHSDNSNSAQSSAVKVSDQPGAIHLLSLDYLRSFVGKPESNGALRTHRMWTTALLDIGSLVFLDGAVPDVSKPAEELINGRTLPTIASKGFYSQLFDQFAVMRNVKPGLDHLHEPEVRVFTKR